MSIETDTLLTLAEIAATFAGFRIKLRCIRYRAGLLSEPGGVHIRALCRVNSESARILRDV